MSIESPTAVGGAQSGTIDVTYNVRYNDYTNLSDYLVYYSLDGGTPVPVSASNISFTPINQDVGQYSFTISNVSKGNHTISLILVEIGGDPTNSSEILDSTSPFAANGVYVTLNTSDVTFNYMLDMQDNQQVTFILNTQDSANFINSTSAELTVSNSTSTFNETYTMNKNGSEYTYIVNFPQANEVYDYEIVLNYTNIAGTSGNITLTLNGQLSTDATDASLGDILSIYYETSGADEITVFLPTFNPGSFNNYQMYYKFGTTGSEIPVELSQNQNGIWNFTIDNNSGISNYSETVYLILRDNGGNILEGAGNSIPIVAQFISAIDVSNVVVTVDDISFDQIIFSFTISNLRGAGLSNGLNIQTVSFNNTEYNPSQFSLVYSPSGNSATATNLRFIDLLDNNQDLVINYKIGNQSYSLVVPFNYNLLEMPDIDEVNITNITDHEASIEIILIDNSNLVDNVEYRVVQTDNNNIVVPWTATTDSSINLVTNLLSDTTYTVSVRVTYSAKTSIISEISRTILFNLDFDTLKTRASIANIPNIDNSLDEVVITFNQTSIDFGDYSAVGLKIYFDSFEVYNSVVNSSSNNITVKNLPANNYVITIELYNPDNPSEIWMSQDIGNIDFIVSPYLVVSNISQTMLYDGSSTPNVLTKPENQTVQVVLTIDVINPNQGTTQVNQFVITNIQLSSLNNSIPDPSEYSITSLGSNSYELIITGIDANTNYTFDISILSNYNSIVYSTNASGEFTTIKRLPTIDLVISNDSISYTNTVSANELTFTFSATNIDNFEINGVNLFVSINGGPFEPWDDATLVWSDSNLFAVEIYNLPPNSILDFRIVIDDGPNTDRDNELQIVSSIDTSIIFTASTQKIRTLDTEINFDNITFTVENDILTVGALPSEYIETNNITLMTVEIIDLRTYRVLETHSIDELNINYILDVSQYANVPIAINVSYINDSLSYKRVSSYMFTKDFHFIYDYFANVPLILGIIFAILILILIISLIYYIIKYDKWEELSSWIKINLISFVYNIPTQLPDGIDDTAWVSSSKEYKKQWINKLSESGMTPKEDISVPTIAGAVLSTKQEYRVEKIDELYDKYEVKKR